jgi:signal transduction protein with GAF and PtsI domain
LAAVVPIEDLRLLEELEGRPDLQEVRAALAEAALLEQMLGSSAAFLKARGCGIFLWDREQDWLRALPPFAGLKKEQVESLTFPIEEAALAPVIREREPVLLNRITGCTPDLGLFRSVGFHNLVAAPLATRRELKGAVLEVTRRRG